MDNKKSYIAAAMIVALAAVAGLSYFSYAQESANNASTAADSQTADSRPAFGRGMMGKNLTDEQKTQMEVDRTARMKEMETAREAVDTALNNNDYNAWKTAVGSDSPMLEKINENNFSRLVEAHKLHEQARAIMTELGIDEPGMGMGGRGMGMGKGGCGCAGGAEGGCGGGAEGGCAMHKAAADTSDGTVAD